VKCFTARKAADELADVEISLMVVCRGLEASNRFRFTSTANLLRSLGRSSAWNGPDIKLLLMENDGHRVI
jgi:hypothetical protein